MADNTGYLFYKKYYEDIDLRQFLSIEQSEVKKRNSSRFQKKNAYILGNKPSRSELDLLNIWRDVKNVERLNFQTTYPGLIIGSGYIHETGSEEEYKLGCFFDHATGWPTIPGSSVKGMLRSYFPQFKSEQTDLLKPSTGGVSGKTLNKAKYIWYMLHNNSFENFEESKCYEAIHKLEKVLFDNWNIVETKATAQFLPSGTRAVFYDGVLSEKNAGKTIFADDAITPHDDKGLKNPVPLLFMRIAPDVKLNFYFKLPKGLFDKLEFTKDQVLELFSQLLSTHGIGAKTNVGYGKLTVPPKPVVFEKGQAVKGELIRKVKLEKQTELSFQIPGNPQHAKAKVKKNFYYELQEGDLLDLLVTSVTDEGIIKYVKLA